MILPSSLLFFSKRCNMIASRIELYMGYERKDRHQPRSPYVNYRAFNHKKRTCPLGRNHLHLGSSILLIGCISMHKGTNRPFGNRARWGPSSGRLDAAAAFVSPNLKSTSFFLRPRSTDVVSYQSLIFFPSSFFPVDIFLRCCFSSPRRDSRPRSSLASKAARLAV
jgi:hypothetical protein